MTLAQPIVHHPFVFRLGPLPLTGFGIAVLAAFLVAQVASERELARRGHDAEARKLEAGDIELERVVNDRRSERHAATSPGMG